jgi:hypothetical protein
MNKAAEAQRSIPEGQTIRFTLTVTIKGGHAIELNNDKYRTCKMFQVFLPAQKQMLIGECILPLSSKLIHQATAGWAQRNLQAIQREAKAYSRRILEDSGY